LVSTKKDEQIQVIRSIRKISDDNEILARQRNERLQFQCNGGVAIPPRKRVRVNDDDNYVTFEYIQNFPFWKSVLVDLNTYVDYATRSSKKTSIDWSNQSLVQRLRWSIFEWLSDQPHT